MAITKTQRWLDLIAFLVKRRFPVSVEDLMEGVPAYAEKWRTEDETARASVRRMFERDKDELRAAGIPLETVPYSIDYGAETAHGYRLAEKDFYLPYLRIVGEGAAERSGGRGTGGRGPDASAGPASPGLSSGGMEVRVTPDEATLVLDALRRVADLPDSPFAAEARSALAKLTFDLERVSGEQLEERERGPEVVSEMLARDAVAEPPAPFDEAPVVFADRGTDAVRSLLRLLTDALHGRKRVRFRYHGIRRGEATDRDVAPYGLLYQHGQWYLVGHDATRDAIRVFRLGRIEDASVGKGSAPEYEHDPDFDIGAYTRRRPWELGDDEPLTADVRFEFPLSLWAARNDHGTLVEELTGGAAVRRFQVRQTGPFLRWLQSFAGDAIVTRPPELRQTQIDMARETLAVYDARGGGGPGEAASGEDPGGEDRGGADRGGAGADG